MKKAWVLAVTMGYGHQRPAFALRALAQGGKEVMANNYPRIPKLDYILWQETRKVYEFISRFKNVPLLGDLVFSFMDKAQEIKPFYKKERVVERPGFQLKVIWELMERKHWGRHLISKLSAEPLPIISTFPIPAFFAEYWEYQGLVYLLVTDSDANRAWVPLFPKESKIRYLAPTRRVAERLRQYGVPASRITYTGFPLPLELTDKDGFLKTKEDLRRRLQRLDPNRIYINRYADVVRRYLGRVPEISKHRGAPVLTFAVGGAGAQQDLGRSIISNLAPILREGKVRLAMLAATHKDASLVFEREAREHRLSAEMVQVLYFTDAEEYFEKFPAIMRQTDILWTKPSELSFYGALGIPLLLSPPVGSQEDQNQEWLSRMGAGVEQLDVASVTD